MKSDNEILIMLIGGVLVGSETDYAYPYPHLLQHSLNLLTAVFIRDNIPIPNTIPQLMALLEQPISNWWRSDELPEGIDNTESLMSSGFPEYWLQEWFLEQNLPTNSLQAMMAELQQKPLRDLIRLCREDAESRSFIYQEVRQFLIEHPYTTIAELRRNLGILPFINLQDIQAYYQEEEVFAPRALHDGCYWSCPHCHGILSWHNGQARCAKPEVCGTLYHDYVGLQPIEPTNDLLRLKRSIHQRVCIPGLSEVNLYHWLQEQPHIETVTLWPHVDRYDLQIRFTNGFVWAVDVKDYAKPNNLGRNISHSGLYNLGDLAWHRGFYVVPDYRVDWDERYIERVSRHVELPDNIEILSASQFQAQVEGIQ